MKYEMVANMSRKFIEESNDRSKALGIKRNQKTSNKVLKERELNDLIKENQELIYVANPFIEQLYDFVKNSNFIVILNDINGCILNIIGNNEMLKKAFNSALVPGAYMGEEYIGTNGMGTCIYEGRPLQVSGEEHYIKVFHKWTCSGAPIRNHKDEVIGCIDLTGDKELVNSHTLGMVAAAANAIESMMKIRRYTEKLSINKNYLEAIMNSFQAAIFSADFDGNPKLINENTSDMFGYDMDKLRKTKVSDIILDWERIRDTVENNDSIFQEDVYVNLKLNKMEVNLSAYPINDKSGKPIEIVFVIKDVKKLRKHATRVMGSKAIYTFDKIIGEDKGFMKTIEFAKKIADSKSTVLIMGDSGTGKEIFAQSIQNYSNRRNEPFVALNCGAIPKNLIESELFGYIGGAFTGAKQSGHPGKFEIADGGTIFLDEIGEMPIDLQTRLLRVIEEGVVRRVGSSDEKPIDIRIIAATNKNLKEEVEKGNFRKDLYYRLNVLPLRLSPLKERAGDIPHLFEYFMKKKSLKLNKREVPIPEEYMSYLMDYEWPGNIRELENIVELIINTESLPSNIGSKSGIIYSGDEIMGEDITLDSMERLHIEKILKKYKGNITKTSTILGISRNTLYRKIEKYGMNVQ
jgi:PAS domain S-box-containing protein